MQSLVGKCKTCFHGFHRHLLYSTAASTSSSTSTDLFADYLVESLGFSHKLALSTSAKLAPRKQKVNDFKFDANANSVVNLFKLHGFDDTHIRKIVSFLPRLLCCNVEKTLEPKIKLLKDEGFSGSDIISVISRNPRFLLLGLESSILPAIQKLRQVLGCDDHVIAFFKSLRGRSFDDIDKCLSHNIALLENYGIPIELIRNHLVRQPLVFLRNPEAFKDMLVRIEQKYGIPRDAPMFLYGLQLAALSEENNESKCQIFKSFGWTDSDIQTLIMKNPLCFSYSGASIKKKLEFLMNELGLKTDYLSASSALFTYSLEKRIVPRHKVLLILKEKGLLDKNCSFLWTVRLSEPCFLKKFVLPFEEVHEVYAKYTGRTVQMLAQEIADNLL